MTRWGIGTAAIAILVAVGVAGCASSGHPTFPPATRTAAAPIPAPTPTPTSPPALSDLVLSPDGLGPLLIGSPPPDRPGGTAVVVWNPTKCGATGAWLPNYPDGPTAPSESGGVGAPFYFAVTSRTDPLAYINVISPQIKTSAGISIGDTLAQLQAAYPHFDAVVKGPATTLYELNGPNAKLVIEVGDAGGVDPSEVGKVVLMEVNQLGAAPGSLYGNDAGGGICPGGA